MNERVRVGGSQPRGSLNFFCTFALFYMEKYEKRFGLKNPNRFFIRDYLSALLLLSQSTPSVMNGERISQSAESAISV